MEIKINLATASLKDAEHAIFIIGAYFGLTQATVADLRVAVPGQDLTVSGSNTQLAAVVTSHGVESANLAGPSVLSPVGLNGPAVAEDAATTFAPPATLPPGAGEAPDTSDPAQVFAGNVAGAAAAPVGPVPPVAPAPSAPTAAAPVGTPAPPPPAPAASALPGVELDADGLPWDQRIHASGEGGTKPKNKDGRWRSKRGLNDGALVARVQAELRATMAAGPRPAPVVAGSNPSGGMTPPVVPAAPAVAPVPPTAPPAASLPPAPPGVPSAPAVPTTLEQLMPRVTKAAIDKVIPGDALLTACKAYDVPSVPALAHRPDLVPYVWTYLQQQYPALV